MTDTETIIAWLNSTDSDHWRIATFSPASNYSKGGFAEIKDDNELHDQGSDSCSCFLSEDAEDDAIIAAEIMTGRTLSWYSRYVNAGYDWLRSKEFIPARWGGSAHP